MVHSLEHVSDQMYGKVVWMQCAYGFATTHLYLNSQLQNSNNRISKTCVLRATFPLVYGYRRCSNCNKGDNGHYVINSKRFPEERAPNSVYGSDLQQAKALTLNLAWIWIQNSTILILTGILRCFCSICTTSHTFLGQWSHFIRHHPM